MFNKGLLLMTTLALCGGPAAAHEKVLSDTIGVEVFFRKGQSAIEDSLGGNGRRLAKFAGDLRSLREDPSSRVSDFRIVSGASPEGSSTLNSRLAAERAASIRSRISSLLPDAPAVGVPAVSDGVDWEGLCALVSACGMPWKEDVLSVIRDTPVWVTENGRVTDSRRNRLASLDGGRPWRYMEEHLFPRLRKAAVTVVVERSVAEAPAAPALPERREELTADSTATVPSSPDTSLSSSSSSLSSSSSSEGEGRPFYMALKSNMLYDAALVPNIGAEIYLGKGWSAGADWMYAWWNSDRRHNYWRLYGGEVQIRRYFGAKAAAKPLSGHHIGLYGQMLTYDVELGGTGYIGGKPGGTIGDRMSWGAGLEYGYSLPVGRRLNIDFGIGIGYFTGEYTEYKPIDTHYVRQKVRDRHWFGPTKAEISLVWLIGRGNVNEKKGKQ